LRGRGGFRGFSHSQAVAPSEEQHTPRGRRAFSHTLRSRVRVERKLLASTDPDGLSATAAARVASSTPALSRGGRTVP
jgi:hypothetical protein